MWLLLVQDRKAESMSSITTPWISSSWICGLVQGYILRKDTIEIVRQYESRRFVQGNVLLRMENGLYV